MDPREFSHRWLPALVARMDRFNQRHPWSHNDHFHPWIVRRLPSRRRSALDVGCGRGELLCTLASHFDLVHGTDRDDGMRAAAAQRVAHYLNASVDGKQLGELQGSYDVITMVAVLHHLETDGSLVEARRLLAPGGRLLVVGLARPESRLDWAWDALCLLTNPLIGLVKHPRPARGGEDTPGFPVTDPRETYADLKQIFCHRLPGASLRRHLGFRYTATWTKPYRPPGPPGNLASSNRATGHAPPDGGRSAAGSGEGDRSPQRGRSGRIGSRSKTLDG